MSGIFYERVDGWEESDLPLEIFDDLIHFLNYVSPYVYTYKVAYQDDGNTYLELHKRVEEDLQKGDYDITE